MFNPVDIMECVYHHNTSVIDPDELFIKYLFQSCKEQKSHRAIFMISNKSMVHYYKELYCEENEFILFKHDTSSRANNSNCRVNAPVPYFVSKTELAQIINHCTDVNEISQMGSILHIAARYYSLQVVQDLVTSGADYTVPDDVGMSVLHLACHDQCLEKVRYFIDLGLETKAVDNAAFSPLHIAAQYSSTDVVQLLL